MKFKPGDFLLSIIGDQMITADWAAQIANEKTAELQNKINELVREIADLRHEVLRLMQPKGNE